VQVPAEPDSAHDWQVPVHALAQQTLCSQKPDAHSLGSAHAAPRSFFPQAIAVQTLPAVQSASVPHAPRQRPFAPHI